MDTTNPQTEARRSRLVELRTKLDAIEAEILSLAEKDVLSEAEEERWDDLNAEREAIRPEYLKLEARLARSEEIKGNTYMALKGVPEFRKSTDELLARGVTRLDAKVARDAALRILEDRDQSWTLSPSQQDNVDRLVRKDIDLARRVLVTEHDAYRSAWFKLLTDPRGAAMLDEAERAALQRYQEYERTQSLASAAGGYAVPVFIDPSVILTDQETDNPFLRICRVVDIQTSTWKGVSSSGVSWSFDAEGSAVSDDSLTSITQPSIDAEMARGFIPFTIEIGDDWPGFQAEMARLLLEGYDELLLNKFTNGAGSGSNEPEGIVTALDASTGVEVDAITPGQFGVEDVYAVWKALPQKYRRNASWMMSVDINNKIRAFGTDAYHAQTVNLVAGAADQLFNRPVYENPYMPDFSDTTSGAVNRLVVGDFSNYVIVRRRGMSVELVPHLVDVTNNRPTGTRGWFAYARIGGGCVNLNAFRLAQNT